MPLTTGDVDRWPTVTTVTLIAAVTPAVLLLAPVLVGAMVERLQFSPQQAGYVVAAELWAMSLASLPALAWMPKIRWRRAAIGLLLAAAFGNLASMSARSVAELMLIRFLTGLADGSLMLICMATIGLTRHPERNFGWWVVGQLALGALGLKILPMVLPGHGLGIVYATLAVLLAALIALTRHLPEGRAAVRAPASPAAVPRGSGAAALLAVLAFYIAVGGSWTYVERIGDRAGFPAMMIGDALTIASLFGIAGSLTATCLGPRLGWRAPLALGYTLLAGGIAALYWPLTESLFRGANCAFKYAWTFVLPYVLACISTLDPSGRLIVLTNLCIGTGLAIGPALAALTLEIAPDYSGVLTLGVAGAVLSFLLILAPATTLARERTA